MDFSSVNDLESAVTDRFLGAEALLAMQNPLLRPVYRQVDQLTLQRRLPGLFETRNSVAAGCLMSLASNFAAVHRPVASYIDRVLRAPNRVT